MLWTKKIYSLFKLYYQYLVQFCTLYQNNITMTRPDAGSTSSLPASDPGSTAAWGSKRINPRPQFCLALT